VADNGVIGAKGGLPWHLPGDLEHFKTVTMGHPILMGRKTFESIGRALPGRRNIVITRQRDWSAPGTETAASLDVALKVAGEDTAVMVIGGAEIFAQALPLADRIELTQVHSRPDGDTFFPRLDPRQWEEIRRENISAAKGPPAYSFVTLIRRDQQKGEPE